MSLRCLSLLSFSFPLSSLALFLLSPTFLSRLSPFSPLSCEFLSPSPLSHDVLTFLLSLLSSHPPVSPTLYFSILLVPSPSLSFLSFLPLSSETEKAKGGARERE
jgi:hypothetical protein